MLMWDVAQSSARDIVFQIERPMIPHAEKNCSLMEGNSFFKWYEAMDVVCKLAQLRKRILCFLGAVFILANK